MNLIKRLFTEEDGQGLTEYALIIALVSIALVIGLGAMSGKLGDVFNKISTDLGNATK